MSTKKELTFDALADLKVVQPEAPAATPRKRVQASPPAPVEARKQVGARVLDSTYRQLKARAALQGAKVQDLVEQAISEYLANHPAP